MVVHLHIRPHDTLFFRDSRPLVAGHGAGSESTLPSPMTIYGSIGNYLLDRLGITLSDFIARSISCEALGSYSTDLANSGGFRIKGPFLALDGKPYIPSPANLLVSGADGMIAHFLRPDIDRNVTFKWDTGDKYLSLISMPLVGPEDSIKPFTGFITHEAIKQYLAGPAGIYRLKYARMESDFLMREPKTGQSINDETGTVNEGMLYSAAHLRLIDRASFAVEVCGVGKSDFSSPTHRIGGDGRPVTIEAADSTESLFPPDAGVLAAIKSDKRFFVCLATPAVLDKGWTRDWTTVFHGATLVGAAVGKPDHISGWMRSGKGAEGGPRPMKRLAPAGSVYFFKADGLNEETIERFYEQYHFNESLSCEYTDAGFGVALMGAW